jgi:hypothetical protein
MTVQQLAAQSEQQRLRASTQPIFKEGTKPEFNPQSGTYQQPAWDDKKQSYSMVDVPGVSPQEQDKFQLESFNKNRTAAKSMMPPGTSDENLDYLAYTLSGMKPPPAKGLYRSIPGPAGLPQNPSGDGKTWVRPMFDPSTNQNVEIPIQDYKPSISKPLPAATQFLQLYTKKILADNKNGPPLTDEENAQLQASKATMDEPGVSRMEALGKTYAQYHIAPITDDSGAAVDVPIASILAANKAGTPPRTAAAGTATGADKNRQAFAQSAIQQVNRMESILNRDPNLTGPGAGQLTALQTWLGAQDPDAQAFLMSSLLNSEHGVAVFGGRNVHTMQDLQNLMGNWKTNPVALKAALEVVRETMTPFLGANNRLVVPTIPRAPGGGGSTGTPKTAADYWSGK